MFAERMNVTNLIQRKRQWGVVNSDCPLKAALFKHPIGSDSEGPLKTFWSKPLILQSET